MPLMRDVPTVDVTVDGDTYTLKTALTFFEREQTDKSNVMKIQLPFGKVERREVRDNDLVDMVMDTAGLALIRLKTWLVRWSHSDKLISANIRCIPPHHADALFEKIQELEESQRGAQENTTLGEPSNSSSDQ